MKHFSARLASVFMALIMVIAMTTPAFAAGGKTDPYGFVWLDESTDIWHFQYYTYDKSEKSYMIKDSASLDGNKLYDVKGNLILSTVRAMDDDCSEASNPTVCFAGGKLYFITKDGIVCRMNSSTDSSYSKTSSVSNAKTFVLDADDLGSKVSSKKLSSLTFSGSYNRDNKVTSGSTPTINTEKKGNYVLTHAVSNDPSKIAYDAYLDGKLIISIYCKNSNVWVETEQLLISDTCVGAKFVGYSHNYYTILYDLDGTVYAFAHDNFNKALPISLGEEIMSYKKDDNGFVESITTSRKTYNLDELLKNYGYTEDVDDISYVKNTSSKCTGYSAYDKSVATLKKSNNYLYWNDAKLNHSYRSTYLGITKEGYPVWINSDGDLYYHNGTKTKFVAENVTLLRYDIDGFAYEYKVGSKIYKFDF